MSDPYKAAFARITGTTTEDVRPGEARNGMVHIVSLILTKTADALIDPKLVLAWLLTALAAPSAMIGLLVPVREAGALLPQLAFARKVEASPERKRFWAAGSAVQGIAAFGIAATALLLTDAWAGGVILACLAVLAVARSASSVSYKDALARTIAKRRRGAITGLAASSEIDASLAVRYDLPLAGTHDILTQYCVDIALYRLAGSSATMTEELRQRYEDAMKGLADIATGKKRLNIAAEPGEDTSESGPNPVTIGGPPRLFSREKMRGF